MNHPSHVGFAGARLCRAALPLLLCLLSFGAPPALAYKAGEGADDMPAAIPEYTDAAAYLADASRTDHRNVKIGQYTLPRYQLEAFNDATGLTNGNLIQTYSNVAAYLADNGRRTGCTPRSAETSTSSRRSRRPTTPVPSETPTCRAPSLPVSAPPP